MSQHQHSCHCHDHHGHDRHKHRDHHHHNHAHHCEHHDHHEHEGAVCAHCEQRLHGESRVDRLTVIRILCAAVLFAVSFFLPVTGTWQFVVCLVPYLLVGYDVLWSALRNVARGEVFDEQLLMALATLGAFGVGELHEGVAVMLLYQLGELLQTLAVGKSCRSIAALMDIRPDTATVLHEGREVQCSAQTVAVGEVIVVRPGERIPLDGRVVKGSSALDTAAITGESVPRTCQVGDTVFSGSVNVSGVLEIEVQSPYGESTVAKILALVEHASEKKAKTERFITRFSRVYTPAVVLVALLLGLGVPLLFSQSFSEWIHRALLFLVVSCPCALVISVPLSFFGGIGGASRRGVLIKGADYLELLARVRVVAFDKTGTLTKGDFSLTEIHSPVLAQNELLGIAAALEAHSVHPLAQGVMRAFDGVPAACEEVTEYAGKGVCGRIAEARYAIGNLALMREQGVVVAEISCAGSVLYLAREGEYLGHLVLCDEPRENAAQAIAALEKQGVRELVMLTGDRLAVAQRVARELAITRVEAELLPDQKVACLETLLGENTVAFVGDGVNDAPVLARADVGVAMGALGSDAAIESADVVLMKDDLGALAEAIAISRKTLRIVRQNIFFALATKAVVLALGALGLVNMWMAVFADVGVMLLAVLNAVRAMRIRKPL